MTVSGHVNVDQSASLLDAAHERATNSGAATLIYRIAVLFTGFEVPRAPDVKPNFAVVAPFLDEAKRKVDDGWMAPQ